MADFVDLVISVLPEMSEKKADKLKIPILIYVYPPNAVLDIWIHDHTNKQKIANPDIEPTTISGFNQIAWIDNVPAYVANGVSSLDHTLLVRATLQNYESNQQCCRIRLAITDGGWGGGSSPPTIAAPSSEDVHTSFTACGYDNPPTTQVTGWVVVNNVSYPGTTLANPPSPYNWAVSFSGLPIADNAELYIQITGTALQTSMLINIKSSSARKTRKRGRS